jgi:hypothetical protein
VSPSLLAVLLRAERMVRMDVAHSRRWYRRTGMTEAQVRYYGARCAWPDACQLVRLNGVGPYVDRLPYPQY